MKIFLAGATGVLGSRLVPLLHQAGHRVAGMSRSPQKRERLIELGAEPVICDAYDRAGLIRAVAAFTPDLVMHQLTDLPDSAAEVATSNAANARMRIEGTDNLIAAALHAGTGRFLAQSVAWEPGGPGKAAKAHLEAAVLGIGGVVVRYGQLYGPGTYSPDSLPEPPRIAVDAAATRTLELLELRNTTVTLVDPED